MVREVRNNMAEGHMALFALLTQISAAWHTSTYAGNGTEGSMDGTLNLATLSEPNGLAVLDDTVYFTEFGGSRIQNTTRCDQAGFKCSTQGPAPCMLAPGRNWTSPINSCDCGCDTFYMMQSGHRVRAIQDGRIRIVAGSGLRGHRDGSSQEAEFNHPYDLVAIPGGDLVIADAYNHVLRMFHANTSSVSTIAGIPTRRGWRDSLDGRAAGLNYPTGLSLAKGSIYVADRGNNCIRMLDLASHAVSTVAGSCNGKWGYRDGSASSALFSGPTSLAVVTSAASNTDCLYIADAANHAVRVLDLEVGTVQTLGVQAPSSEVMLRMPTHLAATPSGDSLFVSSYIGGQVMQYTHLDGATAMTLELVAGNGEYGYADGPGPQASFMGPKALGWFNGTVLVADLFNHRIRMLADHSSDLHRIRSIPTYHHALASRHTRIEHRSSVIREQSIPLSVLVWSGHSGPFHDRCHKDESVPCEEIFADPDLLNKFDVILLYADTYENPHRGNLTEQQWTGLFNYVQQGGGLFALHTASACWDNQQDDIHDTWSWRFHHELLNCAFGGHSPYKDYISTVTDPVHDPITRGLADYVVTDELYHPIVYNTSRSTIFLSAFDRALNSTAVQGMRHMYGSGRVLYFAQGHDMAEFENPDDFTGDHAFQVVVIRSLLWLAYRLE